MSGFDAVIVAGGRGSRMGGLSKADLVVRGTRLLDTVLRAVAGATTTVVVGDVRVPDGVRTTMEEPAGTGPAAGILAGLRAVDKPEPWTLVLAVDLPDAPAATERLRRALSDAPVDADGLCLCDTEGELQHLVAAYRTDALRGAFDRFGDPANRSVRAVMTTLNLLPVDPQGASVDDVDTPEQLAAWNASHPATPNNPSDDAATWRIFVEDACSRLGLDDATVDENAVLRLTRRVAHSGGRPVAPAAAFIWGLAVSAHPDSSPAQLLTRLEAALETAPLPSTKE